MDYHDRWRGLVIYLNCVGDAMLNVVLDRLCELRRFPGTAGATPGCMAAYQDMVSYAITHVDLDRPFDLRW